MKPKRNKPTEMDWIQQIQQAYGTDNHSIIELAKVVSAAHNALIKNSKWDALFKRKELPFRKRKAEMLVAIYEELGGFDTQIFQKIPNGWTVLYELAQLGAAQVEDYVRAGHITPHTTLKQAKELRGIMSEPKQKTAKQWIARLEKEVQAGIEQWSPREQQQAREALLRLAEMFEVRGDDEAEEDDDYEDDVEGANDEEEEAA